MPGATEEVIKNGETGFLIHENDHVKLLEYIEQFLDDPNLSIRMGLEGRKRVKNFFELNQQYEKIRTIMMGWIKKK